MPRVQSLRQYSRNMGTIGGNLLLDTRCNYYDQNYEWRKGIQFLPEEGRRCLLGGARKFEVLGQSSLPI